MQVDFSPVIEPVLTLCGMAITTFGTIALARLAKKYGLQISAEQQDQFEKALGKTNDAMIGVLTSQIAAKGWDHPDIKNAAIANGLKSIVDKFPDALKGVGLSTDASDPINAQRIKDALSRQFAEAAAKASASPSTPPSTAPNPPVQSAMPLTLAVDNTPAKDAPK
jgi:uncharacterized protein YidB (DUF937 family)